MSKPAIRFNDYSDDWDKHKLGECFTERTERSAKGELIAVTINSGVVRAADLDRRSNASEDKSNYKVVKKNDIAYNTMRMWQGASGCSQYDGILSPAYTVVTPCDGIDSVFFSYMFKRSDLIHAFQTHSQGLTSDTWNLKFPSFSEVAVSVPSYEEQQKIGTFFENLDNLISLRQRKLDDTKLLKQAMLQKMFPKDGEDTPVIRFPGFTDAWEQCKLGDLYMERNEKGNSSLPILSVSIHSGISDEELDADDLGKVVRRSEDKTKYKKVYAGDLVFNMMRAWQGAIGVTKSVGMVSPAYITAVPNNELTPMFMDTYLRKPDIVSQIDNLSYGITDFRKRLYWDSFVKVQCYIPIIEEQKKISNFFQELDDLITLHQRELDDLKQLKQALLQQMLV